MNDDLSDDDDLARQYREMCAQDNALLRKLFMSGICKDDYV